MAHRGGGFGGDSTHIRVGPMAVIGLIVMIGGMCVVPFRYPLMTLMVVLIGLLIAVMITTLGLTYDSGFVAPFLLLIAYKMSKYKD